jgi:predicted SnoaL-like aldol condensation-catalyzing enzyme
VARDALATPTCWRRRPSSSRSTVATSPDMHRWCWRPMATLVSRPAPSGSSRKPSLLQGPNQKDAEAALQYVGNRYVQHNPTAADGPEGFRKFIAFLREKFPKSHSDIKRSFVDGDYVILHVNAVREPGTRGSAIVDIFKLENGKIVEPWCSRCPRPPRTRTDVLTPLAHPRASRQPDDHAHDPTDPPPRAFAPPPSARARSARPRAASCTRWARTTRTSRARTSACSTPAAR